MSVLHRLARYLGLVTVPISAAGNIDEELTWVRGEIESHSARLDKLESEVEIFRSRRAYRARELKELRANRKVNS